MQMTKPTDFYALKLKLASPEEILTWSHGEVTKPETINYRTQKPEKDGLFCEKIFGPEKDWECYCGKYRRIRYKGVVCDKCGVEVTRAIVRRERMGHIKLASPVSHIWFVRGVPSKIGLLLGLPVSELERVIYFAAYIVNKVDEEAKAELLKEIDREFKSKLKSAEGDAKKEQLKKAKDAAKFELNNLRRLKVLSEPDFHNLSLKYGQIFEAGIGAEALRGVLSEINLGEMRRDLEKEYEETPQSGRRKILKQLKLIRGLTSSGVRPEWMIMTVLPVLPPDLRPMVQLDGGRFATSDLNDLYRRVINRNNRLKRLQELNAPEVITRNEKRMLQEAVDSLIDNSIRRGQAGAAAAAISQKRPLRSLADMLKGKQGRFRQNLLGKRVDYSGRSVIVIGPELRLHECGLPKKMALELFKPFVINKLIERELAHNIRGAGRLIEEAPDEVWAVLEEVIQDRYVLLNRAPTLHRLGIQAFRPVLIEGFAIRIHPMVCSAFNADFDGDQMAVHLPLSQEAQTECKDIMLASRNLLKPATGEPIAIPTQDIILGCYYLTRIQEGAAGEGKIFASPEEAILAYRFGIVDLKAKIKVRMSSKKLSAAEEQKSSKKKGMQIIETSVGRLLFNEALPEDFEFVNRDVNKKMVGVIIGEIFEKYGMEEMAVMLDRVKKLGFEYATKSGISWGMNDLDIPAEKPQIMKEAEKTVELIRSQYERGLLTDEERKDRVIEIWNNVKNQIAKIVPNSLDKYGSVYSIIDSGARGSWSQPVQMAGMKGLVVNPAGEIIELPVKSSFKEGFNVLEYFISTHGARKGSADTALRTASAGYLTRRLVDVAQDVVVNEEDCKDAKGIILYRKDGEDFGQPFYSRLFGRITLKDIANPADGKTLVKAGEIITLRDSKKIEKIADVKEVNLRSPMACKNRFGVCQKCYGYDLGKNQLVAIGEAVGIVAAQAIGEPGTQLTMRTFHTGGVAGGGDITQGLPRVAEIFEARVPKSRAVISEVDGTVVEVVDKGKFKVIKIASSSAAEKDKKMKKEEIKEYQIPLGSAVWVSKGELIAVGQQLCEGHVELRDLLDIAGVREIERYIVNEIQRVYTTEGASINNKHVEVIVRQMFSRVMIKDAGDTYLTPGDVLEKSKFLEQNDLAKEANKKPATAVQLLLGITKVALTTESFLSAASFQETPRVLINAATEGKVDKLRGLKENVIIGKLIPAGTGYKRNAPRLGGVSKPLPST